MSKRAQRVGLLGAAAGAVAAGVAAGLAVERYAIGRERLRPDPEAREPFGRLPGVTPHRVTTSDGVELYAEVSGRGDVTVVFVHGFLLELASWHYQRRDLAEVARLVAYDHRGHGRSERGDDDGFTVVRLARDLADVLEALAPDGPVILVGHSMGGMTIMALAEERPDLFAGRIVGVALLGTAVCRVAERFVPLPARAGAVVANRLMPGLHRRLRRATPYLERTRRIGSDISYLAVRGYAFGRRPAPAHVEFVERMVSATRFDVLTGIASGLASLDLREVVAGLSNVPVLIVHGTHDHLFPKQRCDDMVACMSHAELVILDGAGHMVQLERAALVNLHLRAFIRRCTTGRRRSAGTRGA